MRKPPLAVFTTGCLFVLAGLIGVAYHGYELTEAAVWDARLAGMLLVRGLAIVGGIFLLRGANWARWLLIAWMGFHTVLSLFHSIGQAAMHLVILALVAFLLFRPSSSRFFHSTRGAAEGESQT